MTDFKDEHNNEINHGKVIYQRDPNIAIDEPKFKPGNTPYTQFGNETLNANVPWYRIVQEILAHYTQEQLVKETGITSANITKILRQNYRKLNFKRGAQLLSIHARLFADQQTLP